jgi:hypothetical protein
METLSNELQSVGNARSPVNPGVSSIPRPEFMLDLPVPQKYVQGGIPFIQEIIVPAIDVKPHLFNLVLWQLACQVHDAVFPVMLRKQCLFLCYAE